jgi:hypothetical protein
MKSLEQFETIINFQSLISFSFEDVISQKVIVDESTVNTSNTISFDKPLWSYLTIKSKNWTGTLIINFTEEFIYELMGKEDIDLGFDALGETLNTIAGAIAGQEDIIEVFGEFIQDPPRKSKSPISMSTQSHLSLEVNFNQHTFLFAIGIEPNQ